MKTRFAIALVLVGSLLAAPASAIASDALLEGSVPGRGSNMPIDFAASVHEILFPLVGDNHYSDDFGACRGANCERTHEGIDILADKMVPIIAVASGTVGWIDDERGGDCCAFALEHDDGWESYYIHMNNDSPGTDDGQGFGFAPWVRQGAHVDAGQLVGWVGDSGNAEAINISHLHYELHKPGDSGGHVVINPFGSLNAATRVGAPTVPGGVRGCDFDGDGWHDLAVGAPGEDVKGGSIEDAGAVTVLFGSGDGVDAERAIMLRQSTRGVASRAESGDRFGAATACGDFDGDGHDDLVVGVPGEGFGVKADVGAINVLFGTDSGLDPRGKDLWHQGRSGVPSDNGAGDRFGSSLAVGDFDGDGFDDVAVGAPGETIGGAHGAGAVIVFYGSGTGLGERVVAYDRDSEGVPGAADAADGFGLSLAAASLDGEGGDDLAVGIPFDDSGSGNDSGAVVVLFGNGSGLSSSGAMLFRQGRHGVKGEPSADERFGWSMSAGDTNGDMIADLAVGVPGDSGPAGAVGAVNLLLGSDSGPTGSRDLLLRPGKAGLPGPRVDGARFGEAVTMGDFDLNGYSDLAIGSPGSTGDTGEVIVVPSLWDGVLTHGAKRWNEAKPGVKSDPSPGDEFGAWLVTGAVGKHGYSALVVGVPLKDKAEMADTGAVHVLRGGRNGVMHRGDRVWRQSSHGMPGSETPGDRWGHVVRAAA